MRRQDSNLRPPGYELRKAVFSLAALKVLPLFRGNPEDQKPPGTTVSIPSISRMGQRMGQTCGPAMGLLNQRITLSFWNYHHIQGCFGFLFSHFTLTTFPKDFSSPVSEPPARAGLLFSSSRNLTPRLHYGPTV